MSVEDCRVTLEYSWNQQSCFLVVSYFSIFLNIVFQMGKFIAPVNKRRTLSKKLMNAKLIGAVNKTSPLQKFHEFFPGLIT